MTWRGSVACGLGVEKKKPADWTPLEKEVIKRKGATDESSFKAYGQVTGTIGGAALCVATGVGAAVAVGCGVLGGIIGGIIGGVLGKQIKILTGKTDEEKIASYWNSAVGEAKEAGRGILAVKAYLTMRDYALSLGYSEAELVKSGLPPAPVSSRWKPSAARWEQAKQNYAYVQQAAAKGGQKSNDCSIAKSLGITSDELSCADFLYMTFWRGARGPVAAPSDPIDWYAVGRDEVTVQKGGPAGAPGGIPGGICDNAFPTLKKGAWLDTNVNCPSTKPSDVVRPFIAQINNLAKVKESKALPPVSKPAPAPPSRVVPLVVGGGIAALVIWALL